VIFSRTLSLAVEALPSRASCFGTVANFIITEMLLFVYAQSHTCKCMIVVKPRNLSQRTALYKTRYI